MNGYRARRIEQVLAAKPKVGPEDFRALHLDFTCLPGQEFVKRLRGFSTSDARAGQARARASCATCSSRGSART